MLIDLCPGQVNIYERKVDITSQEFRRTQKVSRKRGVAVARALAVAMGL